MAGAFGVRVRVIIGFFVGFLVFKNSQSPNTALINNDKPMDNTPSAPPPLPSAKTPFLPVPEIADAPPTDKLTSPPTPEPVLSLAERKKFHTNRNQDDISLYRPRKATPSGWWPDSDWVESCVLKERDLKPFVTLEKWVDYRLGDCVKLCRGCPEDNDPPLGFDDYTSELAHWTIAGEYYDKVCAHGRESNPSGGNETLLNELVDKRMNLAEYTIPDPHDLVIHLRLGDKIEDAKASVYEMLQESSDPGRKSFTGFHAVKSVYEFLTNILESKATKVVIRGGSQIPDMYMKSKTYAYCLQEAFEKAGFETDMNLEEGNADKDFIYMVNAKKMIVTLGGFSRFIGHLVLERGGIVYGRMYR